MNDTALKQALAKMLPEKVRIWKSSEGYLTWQSQLPVEKQVLNTELLHLCWLVEETLTLPQGQSYYQMLPPNNVGNTSHATWQQRTIALCKVKGITI